MENPNGKRENELMARIIKLTEMLNQLVMTVNHKIQQINQRNTNIEVTNNLWKTYTRNCGFDDHK